MSKTNELCCAWMIQTIDIDKKKPSNSIATFEITLSATTITNTCCVNALEIYLSLSVADFCLPSTKTS